MTTHGSSPSRLIVSVYSVVGQQGLLVHAGAEWTLRADGITTAIGLPERLQQLMTRRLEAFPEPTQRLCQLAEQDARTASKVPTR
jgi:hypothetical protein